MEGSVDEESTKSDEEYDDLAMKDGYSSDDDEESRNGTIITENTLLKDMNNTKEHDKKSTDLLNQSDEASHKLRRCHSHSDRNQRSKEERNRNRSQSDFPRVRSRSHSIPSSFFGEQPVPQSNGRTTPGQTISVEFPFK